MTITDSPSDQIKRYQEYVDAVQGYQTTIKEYANGIEQAKSGRQAAIEKAIADQIQPLLSIADARFGLTFVVMAVGGPGCLFAGMWLVVSSVESWGHAVPMALMCALAAIPSVGVVIAAIGGAVWADRWRSELRRQADQARQTPPFESRP